MRVLTNTGDMVQVGAADFSGGIPQRHQQTGSVELLRDDTGVRHHQRYAVVARTNPWVMSSVNERAALASRAPLHVFRPQLADPQRRERVRVGDDGPGVTLARLLHRPAERKSGQRFRRRLAGDRLVHGNAFAEFVYDGAQIVGLRWHPWNGVVPRFSDDGLDLVAVDVPTQRRHRWWQTLDVAGSRMRTIPVEDGLHLTINDDTESPLGVSPLESLHATHALHEAAWRFARAYLENGMFPSGVVELPEKATLEQAKLTRELIEQLQVGVEKGGRPGVIGFGKWQQVMATPEGAKLVELAKASREEVATAYRMAWLGNVEDMNRATAEQARQAFIRDVVGEDVGVFEAEINAQMVGPSRRWSEAGVFVEGELGELLRPDMEALAKVIQSEVGAPVLTPNEGRELLNKPPLPGEEGNRLVLNPGTPGASRLAVPSTGELWAEVSHRTGSNVHRLSAA